MTLSLQLLLKDYFICQLVCFTYFHAMKRVRNRTRNQYCHVQKQFFFIANIIRRTVMQSE
jgi:hypothetical protein